MGLMQLNEHGDTKIDGVIALLREMQPPEGYYVANSGGKDSGVIIDLCKRAGVKFDAHYCVSPIDPPEVYKFLKEHHSETYWEYHAKNFWKLVEKQGLPTRRSRWCCRIIKESGGNDRTVITGIRWAESASRKNRCMIENSRVKKENKQFLHPIICWSDEELWEYYRIFKIPYLDLYDRGWKRVGCIGCPLGANQKRELSSYPKISYLWKRSAFNFFNSHPENNTHKQLKTPENFWNWWVSGKSIKNYLNEQQGILVNL